jgi:hypothetical protein
MGLERSRRSADPKVGILDKTNSLKLEFSVNDNLSGEEKKFFITDWDAFIQYGFSQDFTLGTADERDSEGNIIPRFQKTFGFDDRICKLRTGDERLKYLADFVTRKNLDDFKHEIQRKTLDITNSKPKDSNPYLDEKGEWFKGFLVDYDGYWVPTEFFLITDRIPNLCCCYRSVDGTFIFGKNVSDQELFDIRKRRFWFEREWSYHLDQPQIQYRIREKK